MIRCCVGYAAYIRGDVTLFVGLEMCVVWSSYLAVFLLLERGRRAPLSVSISSGDGDGRRDTSLSGSYILQKRDAGLSQGVERNVCRL